MPTSQPGHVVLVIHGICDVADWHQLVKNQLGTTQLEVRPINLGYYHPALFLSPWDRSDVTLNKLTRHWQACIDSLQSGSVDGPPPRISIICHSFGTWLVSRMFSEHLNFKVFRIVFCGSVVDVDFPWDDYKDSIGVDINGQPIQNASGKHVLNQCGLLDRWPLLAAAARKRYGYCGWRGFNMTAVVENKWYFCNHAGFLRDKTFYAVWKSFLAGSDPQQFTTRKPPQLHWIEEALADGQGSLVRLVFRWLGTFAWLVAKYRRMIIVGALSLAVWATWVRRHSIHSGWMAVLLWGGYATEQCSEHALFDRYKWEFRSRVVDQDSPLFDKPLAATQQQFAWTVRNKTDRTVYVFIRDFTPDEIPQAKMEEVWWRAKLGPREELGQPIVLADEFDSIMFHDQRTTGRVLIAVVDAATCSLVYPPQPHKVLPTLAQITENSQQAREPVVIIARAPDSGAWEVECLPLW